ncbi:MAG: hemerythrin [Candidatus Accumulibacter necessarius]|uniref:hemerythrin n=1 Tax=Candidatus Accumulibacter necessarius TaxID=2954386 RepID=UPI002FC28E99
MSDFFLGSLVMEINLAGLLPEALLIDLPEIDVQHEEIFRRIEALKKPCFGSGPSPSKNSTACLTIWNITSPAKSELRENSASDFVDHAECTDENLQALRKAFAEVHDGARDVHSFLRYAEYWFERHITDEDKPFAASVRKCRLCLPAA